MLTSYKRDGLRWSAAVNVRRKAHISLFLPLLLISLLALPLRAASPKESALHQIGFRTIRAIANGDAAYIASIADPEGIYVGYDGIRHSANSFRGDLAHHIGMYCELFEKGCKTVHDPSYTLQHVFKSGTPPSNSDLKFRIDGNAGTLEYFEFGGDGDLIATFTYRFADGKWRLRNIHYV